MTYKTILVQLSYAGSPQAQLTLANALAEKFDAKLIGVAAHPLPLAVQADGSGLLVQQAVDGIDERLRELRDAFMSAVDADRVVDWRSFVDSPVRALAMEARAADLILADVMPNSAGSSEDPSGVVLSAGRPVLMASPGATRVDAEKVMIGWKDTKESRRAVRDALPFLQAAKSVSVVTITDEASSDSASATDVAGWLGRHGIKADAMAADSRELIAGERLVELVQEQGADLLVTGAYGHSRFMEWAFGGVTQELLQEHKSINRLMSG